MRKTCKECSSLYVYCSSCTWKEDTFAKEYGFCCNRCMRSYCLKEGSNTEDLEECKEYIKNNLT